jgi:hypothetical protein
VSHTEVDEVPQPRTLSERAIEREYAIGRATLRDARRRGDLPAYKLHSRKLTFLRDEVEHWIRSHAVAPEADR